jgi:hypothetical protein
MTRFVPFVLLALVVAGCPKRDQPPASAYDDDLLQSADEIADDSRQAQEREAALGDETGFGNQEVEGECTRETGGCKKGFLCWDSYYCRQGNKDQCTASGDKMCHKLCVDDGDCPRKMPVCTEKPIFHGTDRGVLEKFCVRASDE